MSLHHDELYEVCSICEGHGAIPHPASGMRVLHCRGCDGLRFVRVGVTVRQLEILSDRERALDGDPGIHIARRANILARLAFRLKGAVERDGITIHKIQPDPQAVTEGGGPC
jgi:hypothetical protein